MAQKHVIIVCGEASGDLNASNLIQKILEINPDIKISGVGGALMRQAGARVFYDIKDLAVIGFFDALKKLPEFFSLKKVILEKLRQEKTDAIILVDFSGFNLRLAKAINKTIPVIYYVSPQVWASRRGRLKTIKKYITKMIVLFKFEEEFYKNYGIDVEFVGHPLLDTVKPSMDKKEFLDKFGFSESKTTIALLPGSRIQEIKNILPIMLRASLIISKRLTNTQFLIAKSAQIDRNIYNRIVRAVNIDLKIIENKTYDCLNIADFSLVASGTATLETAIMQKPFIILYKMNCLNYLFYRPQVKLPYIGMVNIVGGKKIVPEFIQFQAKSKNIASEAIKFLKSPSRMQQIKDDLAKVKSLLGETGASLCAAKIILNYLK